MSRKGTIGGVGPAADQPFHARDWQKDGTLRAAYHLRAAAHVGDVDVGRLPACGADQPVYGAQFDTYYADLSFPYQQP